jgi:Zn-dependent peptidase ImmA (M78 family)
MAVVRLYRNNIPAPDSKVTSLQALMLELTRVGLYKVPIDVAGAAEFLGIDVFKEIMDDDVSGYLEFRGGRWIVGLNSLHHKLRQRFTLAHEIAHFVLHRSRTEKFVDETFARRAASKDTMEREADRFAAEFLMPGEAVRKAVDDGTNELDSLSQHFQVSALAMKYRLQTLKYIITEHG